MFVVQFDPKHGSGEDGGDDAFDFNMFFFHLYCIENRSAEQARNPADHERTRQKQKGR